MMSPQTCKQVVTVRDFSLIFDALTTFEEALLAARMGGKEQAGLTPLNKANMTCLTSVSHMRRVI